MKSFPVFLLKTASLLLFTLCFLQSPLAQIQEKAAIDSIFLEWDRPDVPGCGLGVIKNGQLIYARGYGMANLEYDIPNDETSVFRIGSTSKQFTAACIVLLAEQGKLSLDDKLRTFFPDFPPYADQISIRHLLNHTSGIRDYLMLSSLKGYGPDDYYEDRNIMQWLVRQKDLNFSPGDEFLYSNSGYWLLGQIVKEVAGQNMADFAKSEIFNPLGMNNTHFHNDHNQIVKHRASGYRPSGDGTFKISMTTLDMIGDGGIFTSVNDMLLWNNAHYDDEVLSQDFWKMMTERGVLNNGDTLDYASGLTINKYKGLKTISHGGAFVGFRAEYIRFPEQRFAVMVFANRADANPTQKCYQVADILLKDYIREETKAAPRMPKSEDMDHDPEMKFDQLAGVYEMQPGANIEVLVQHDTLMAILTWSGETKHLVRKQGNAFRIVEDEGFTLTFSNMEDGQASQFVLQTPGNQMVCKRKKVIDPTGVNLNDYPGRYYSEELDVVYEVTKEEEGLALQFGDKPPRAMQMHDKDHFLSAYMLLRFQRLEDKVGGFELDAGRVKNLKFTRME